MTTSASLREASVGGNGQAGRLSYYDGNRHARPLSWAGPGRGLHQFPDEVDHGGDIDRQHDEGGNPGVSVEFVDFKGDKRGVHDGGQIFRPQPFPQQPGPHREHQGGVDERDGADPGKVRGVNEPRFHQQFLEELILAADFPHVGPMVDHGRQIPVNEREHANTQRDEESTVRELEDGNEDKANIAMVSAPL